MPTGMFVCIYTSTHSYTCTHKSSHKYTFMHTHTHRHTHTLLRRGLHHSILQKVVISPKCTFLKLVCLLHCTFLQFQWDKHICTHSQSYTRALTHVPHTNTKALTGASNLNWTSSANYSQRQQRYVLDLKTKNTHSFGYPGNNNNVKEGCVTWCHLLNPASWDLTHLWGFFSVWMISFWLKSWDNFFPSCLFFPCPFHYPFIILETKSQMSKVKAKKQPSEIIPQ